MELSIAIALALALYLLGQWLHRRASQRHCQHLGALQSTTLQRALELLQHLQKHRGLGAQQDIVSVSQRNAIARQLDQLWLNWPGPSLQLAPLQEDWPRLRRNPADFAAHCQLIEGLLKVIEQLEERLCLAATSELGGLGQACRVLEDLARLRGLAVRATNYKHCPAGLQQQQISLHARMIAIVDTYDAITAQRVYKSGQSCVRALKILRSDSPAHFDLELVKQFIAAIGMYPPGTLVLMDSEKLALVLQNNWGI